MLIVFSLLGLAFGSFINAAVYRLHENARKSKQSAKLSLVSGRSICPNCKHQLATLDLIPVLSWLWLRGRCRYCGEPISIRYPLVELLTAALFGLSFWQWQFSGVISKVEFGFWLVLLVGLIILAIYDLRWMILPNKVMEPLLLIAMIQLIVLLLLGEPWQRALEHLLAALSAGGFFYLLYAAGKGGWMGGGDVKLALLIGLILGARGTLVALVLGFNLAAIFSIGLIVRRRASRKSLIPFGPFLILATIIAQLYGQSLWQFYVRLVTIY